MRHTGRDQSTAASSCKFVLEPLEARKLMSDAAGIVPIQWEGQSGSMRPGEWIVGLTYPGSTYNEDTGEFSFNGVPSRSATPSPELKTALGAAERLGVEFSKYLGSEDIFLIKVPDGVSLEQLNNALQEVPQFQQVEPNAVATIDEIRGELDIVPVKPPASGPRAELDIVPVKPPASGPRAELDIVPVAPPGGPRSDLVIAPLTPPHAPVDIIPVAPPSGIRGDLDIVQVEAPVWTPIGSWASIEEAEEDLLK